MYKLLILILISSITHAQDITGDWHGQLNIMGTKLRISFHIKQDKGTYISTLDSLDQGAFDLATDSTEFVNGKLTISMKNLGADYVGTLDSKSIKGTFTQNGASFPLDLTGKEIAKPKVVIRPQDPIEPFEYLSEEVTFINKSADSIKLAGTLTLPKDVENPAVAILITGSGPQNRNEELGPFNHRPFLVLSDHLTKKGIAVLRYDDRGVAESEGKHKGATSADFATDVAAAVDYLKTRSDIDTHKIGLIGHSEGGFIAPMLASSRDDIAFIVMLAGTGVDGATILKTQGRKSAELSGESTEKLDFNEQLAGKVFDLVIQEKNTEKLVLKLSELFKKTLENSPKEMTKDLTEETIQSQIKTLSSNWFQYFIRTDPQQFLSKVNCPVLAINGEKDFQVLPKLNLNAIDRILKQANNKDFTIKELAGMNHLFQTAETGAITEYGTIEETFSPIALNIVSEWINKRFSQ
jgi:alpha/beta superfamily hydrolase